MRLARLDLKKRRLNPGPKCNVYWQLVSLTLELKPIIYILGKIQILGQLATRQCIWVKFWHPQFLLEFIGSIIFTITRLGKIHILLTAWRCVRWGYCRIQKCTWEKQVIKRKKDLFSLFILKTWLFFEICLLQHHVFLRLLQAKHYPCELAWLGIDINKVVHIKIHAAKTLLMNPCTFGDFNLRRFPEVKFFSISCDGVCWGSLQLQESYKLTVSFLQIRNPDFESPPFEIWDSPHQLIFYKQETCRCLSLPFPHSTRQPFGRYHACKSLPISWLTGIGTPLMMIMKCGNVWCLKSFFGFVLQCFFTASILCLMAQEKYQPKYCGISWPEHENRHPIDFLVCFIPKCYTLFQTQTGKSGKR